MYDWVLALALLNTPAGEYNDGTLCKVSQSVWNKVCRLAVEGELLDDRVEKTYTDSFGPIDAVQRARSYWLWVLRDRCGQLEGVPFVIDQKRWPHIEDVKKGITFAFIYERELMKQHEECRKSGNELRKEEVSAIYGEAIALSSFYEQMKFSMDEREHVDARRFRMKIIIKTIGEDNYFRGNFPPPVPLWHFQWRKE
jgi:hypothetical protein